MSPDVRHRHLGGSGREDILTVAKRLFMTRGYRAVTTREIADAVGLTQPALYHHFGGKEALYVAVLEADLAAKSRRMQDALNRTDLAGEDRLRLMAAVLASDGDYDLNQMTHDLRQEVSAATYTRVSEVFANALVEPVIAVLRVMESEGAVAPPEQTGFTPFGRAMYVLSVVRSLSAGFATRAQEEGPPDPDPDTIGARTVHLLQYGLGGPASPQDNGDTDIDA